MTLLLDTHVLLWALGAPHRLPEPVRSVLADRRTPVLVSAASAFEIATKHRLGRLPEASVLMHQFEHQTARLGAQLLPITSSHAISAGSLDWTHRDPFDRILAAQAMSEGVELVSADRIFVELAGLTVRWTT